MKRVNAVRLARARPWPAAASVGRVALAVLAFAYGLAAATVAARRGAFTTYAGNSGLAGVAELATGWALVAAGLLAAARSNRRRAGRLVAAAGVAWFAGDWAGWEGGPAAIRTLGFVVGGLTFALVFDAVASWAADARSHRVVRALAAVVYAETAFVAIGRLLFRDPFGDPHCWSDCTSTNPFLVDGDRSFARALDFVDIRFAIASGAALLVLVAWRIAAARAPARRRLWPLLIPGAAFAALHAARGLALLGGRTEDPRAGTFAALFGGRCVALVAFALGLLWMLVRARATRAAVTRLADELGEAPAAGSLATAIANAVGDPSLTVGYWLPSTRCYVGGDGRRLDLATGPGRAVTPIVRGVQPVAVVVHDPAALDSEELVREIGAAARLAVDNERLAAEARAQLLELTASRARIVATGDTERRRLERDLHDGAQQRLLALSYELRVARASADAGGDGELSAELAGAVAETEAALDELRELAHGICPAVLEESGLAVALKTLAQRSPVAVELDLDGSERAPAEAERAAYVMVDETIADAAARGATFAAVAVSRANGSLCVSVRDDGEPRRGGLPRVADRLGALNSTVSFGPATIEAEIPCG